MRFILALIAFSTVHAFAATCGDAPLTKDLMASCGPAVFNGVTRVGWNTPGWNGTCRQSGLMYRYYPKVNSVEFIECVAGMVKYDLDPDGVDCTSSVSALNKVGFRPANGFGTCYNSTNCSGATVSYNVTADECSSEGGYSFDDGSGCQNL